MVLNDRCGSRMKPVDLDDRYRSRFQGRERNNNVLVLIFSQYRQNVRSVLHNKSEISSYHTFTVFIHDILLGV